MILHNIIILILIVTFCECHEHHRHGVKGRTGHNFKSYGGYFPDNAGYNEASNHFINTQNYNHPQLPPYQSYGWNVNQPRRTYGGVNVLNHRSSNNDHQNPQYPPNHIGWANTNMHNYAGINPAPMFPTLPQPNFFFPNFFPQFPFQTFPNMNQYGGNYPQHHPNHRNNENLYPHQRPQVDNNQGVPIVNDNRNAGQPNYLPPNREHPCQSGNINNGRCSTHTNIHGSTPNLQHSQGHLPYPQNNLMPTIPTANTNLNTGEFISQNNRGQIPYAPSEGSQQYPGQLPYPQNNNFPAVPIDRNNNLPIDRGQPIYPQSVSNQNGLNGNTDGVDYQFPQTPDSPKPSESSSDIDVRFSSSKNRTESQGSGSNPNRGFATNSFFENNNRRQWTNDDELKWQATTKAPYFENKLPGLECSLPAAAVLGASNAFKTSSLLPLNVPIGKPILSCNATNLMQSQVRLDGKIYDCSNSDITISCPSHGGNVNECEGQVLQCHEENYNADTIYCTNGTLVSNSHVVCESASIMPSKSILNCAFKGPIKVNLQSTTQAPNVLPVLPLPTGNNANTNVDNRNQQEELFNFDDYDQEIKEPQDLMPQVKKAMENVFPHNLLSMTSTKYLPPNAAQPPQIGSELKNHISSVFNVDLLASSKDVNENELNEEKENDVPRLSGRDFNAGSNNQRGAIQANNQIADQMRARWNVNPNIDPNSNSGIKTKTFENRFDGQQHPLQHRLIFTD